MTDRTEQHRVVFRQLIEKLWRRHPIVSEVVVGPPWKLRPDDLRAAPLHRRIGRADRFSCHFGTNAISGNDSNAMRGHKRPSSEVNGSRQRSETIEKNQPSSQSGTRLSNQVGLHHELDELQFQRSSEFFTLSPAERNIEAVCVPKLRDFDAEAGAGGSGAGGGSVSYSAGIPCWIGISPEPD